jgi:phosphatidylglycerophosphate synthase
MVDPPNRYVRYPAAHGLYRIAGFLPFTPNQITFFHAALGGITALLVAFADARWLPLGFLLFEIRGILDCYDGVVARNKKLSSTYGRTLDEMADGFAALTLLVGMSVRQGTPLGWGLSLSIVAQAGISAWACDFFKRKFTSALKTGKDGIVAELRPKYAAVRAGGAGFFVNFGYLFDSLQVRILSRHNVKDTFARIADPHTSLATEDMARVRAQADSGRFRFALRSLAIMTGDNSMLVLSFGLLFNRIHEAQIATLSFGLLTFVLGIVSAQSILRREAP